VYVSEDDEQLYVTKRALSRESGRTGEMHTRLATKESRGKLELLAFLGTKKRWLYG
jgi:hypothetical protein